MHALHMQILTAIASFSTCLKGSNPLNSSVSFISFNVYLQKQIKTCMLNGIKKIKCQKLVVELTVLAHCFYICL